MTSKMRRLSQAVTDAIEEMELTAEEEFLERVRAVSIRFPDRLIEVLGGMGRLNVNIYARHQHQFNWYGFGGQKYYEFNESGEMDAPEFMRSVQDYLFREIILIQDEHGVMYRNYPMVGCGFIKFRNGKEIQ